MASTLNGLAILIMCVVLWELIGIVDKHLDDARKVCELSHSFNTCHQVLNR